VLYLDKGVVELPGYIIMGCILWSHIPDKQKQTAAQSMNDYRLIFKSSTYQISTHTHTPHTTHHTHTHTHNVV
jgi:hypothetical protein